MKTLTAMLTLLIVIAALLLPIAMIIWGLNPALSLGLRIALIIIGMVMARLFKPLSILLDCDLKIV